MGLKMCKVTVGSKEKAYPDGTPFGEIVKDFDQDCKYPVVLVTVDGKLRELHKKIHRDCRISLVTVEDSIGHKTYKRSMNLLLLKAYIMWQDMRRSGRLSCILRWERDFTIRSMEM